jgi:hypothetical protein
MDSTTAHEELKRRRGLTFAQAEGVEPLPAQLGPKELSPELRAHLWAVLYDKLKLGSYYAPIWVDISALYTYLEIIGRWTNSNRRLLSRN